jgi:hypothetical protein
MEEVMTFRNAPELGGDRFLGEVGMIALSSGYCLLSNPLKRVLTLSWK